MKIEIFADNKRVITLNTDDPDAITEFTTYRAITAYLDLIAKEENLAYYFSYMGGIAWLIGEIKAYKFKQEGGIKEHPNIKALIGALSSMGYAIETLDLDDPIINAAIVSFENELARQQEIHNKINR